MIAHLSRPVAAAKAQASLAAAQASASGTTPSAAPSSETPSPASTPVSVSAVQKAEQQALADAGYYDAEVDGVYGPATVAAEQALQKANGLPQTGTVDKATEKGLRSELAAKGGAAAQEDTASTAAVQQTLEPAGYRDGPVDRVWTDAFTVALHELQTDLGVSVTCPVDAATVAAFEKAVADAGFPPPPSPSPSPTPTASS